MTMFIRLRNGGTLVFTLIGLWLLLGLTGCEQAAANRSQPDADQASSAPADEAVAAPPEPASTAYATAEPQQAEGASSRDESSADVELTTFSAIGLYHLLATLNPYFALGSSISVEDFSAFANAHVDELGYLMKSSYLLASEFRECLDEGQLTRQEVVYMLANAVQGELEEEYPLLIPAAAKLIGADAVAPAVLAELFTENFLREMAMEGGQCRQLSMAGVELDCSLFRSMPTL